jgi:hypothetical protein
MPRPQCRAVVSKPSSTIQWGSGTWCGPRVLRMECLVLELSPVAASLESTVQHGAVWLGAGQVRVVAAFDRGTANRAYGDGGACGLRLRSRKPAPAKAALRVRFL